MDKRLAAILWWAFCLGLIGFVITPFLVH